MTAVLHLWLFVTGAFPALFVRLARRVHLRKGGDLGRFPERLGQTVHAPLTGRVLWFHAASLGEVAQLRELAHRLARDRDTTLLITTTTQSGADWVARTLPEAVHQFCPIDIPSAVDRFLDHWKPAAAIFVEADIWPRLVLGCHARRIPLVLLNARASRTRSRLPRTMGALLARFSLVTCRNDTIAAEMRRLGVAADRVRVTGDLKASSARLPVARAEVDRLAAEIGPRPVWVAASTHAEDEAPILAAQSLLAAMPDPPLLVWAPRHPGRAIPIRTAAEALRFSVAQRTQAEPVTGGTSIYIADTLGELGVFFALSRVVFLGGSFGGEGGHNPYEPAQAGACVLTGPNTRNFTDAFDGLQKAGGAQVVADGAALAAAVSQLLRDGAGVQGDKARDFAARQIEALEQSERAIRDLLRLP